jgi:hypothetical protein
LAHVRLKSSEYAVVARRLQAPLARGVHVEAPGKETENGGRRSCEDGVGLFGVTGSNVDVPVVDLNGDGLVSGAHLEFRPRGVWFVILEVLGQGQHDPVGAELRVSEGLFEERDAPLAESEHNRAKCLTAGGETEHGRRDRRRRRLSFDDTVHFELA